VQFFSTWKGAENWGQKIARTRGVSIKFSSKKEEILNRISNFQIPFNLNDNNNKIFNSN
jgi:hypothetical protein